MHDKERTTNLLGAASLAISDLSLAAVTNAAETSASSAAALVVLVESPGVSVTELGRRVGLSQSAAARMVDSLQVAGLVDRQRGAGREVRVTPTMAGRDAAARLLQARGLALTHLVAALDPSEQDTLAALLAKLLAGLYGEVGSSELLCRLCDRPACTKSATCPVGQAERDRGA